MHRKGVLFVVFLLLVNCASAQESMMDNVSYPFLEKLIAAAKANYPRYKTYEARVDIARSNVQKANFDWFNIFSFSYVRSPDSSTNLVSPIFLNGYQYGFTINVGSILQKPAGVRIAKKELQVAHYNQDEFDLSIEAIVKQRYFTYIQAQTLLNWKLKTLETAERSSKDMQYKFEKGEVTFDVYNRSESYYTSAVQDKINGETQFLIAKSALEEMIGAKLETIK